MVYNFGGGLCSGYAGNPYFNGSKFAIEHGVIVVTVSYRLGALGFLVSESFDGPGNGGMTLGAVWSDRFIPYFKGDPNREVMAAANVSSLAELREVPAEKVQWPAYTMNDPALWAEGKVNPEAIMVGFNSKDGTAAFYGVAPTMGYVPPDENQTGANDYEKAIRKVWGTNADAVLQQYPLSRFDGSPQKAFLQADADSMVICPSYQLLRYAQAMDVPSWAFEFAHFIPSARPDGFGCSNGPELDAGPDGVGPPNNRTLCTFTASERALSEEMRARWASFAASGQPMSWPRYLGPAATAPTLVLSDTTDDRSKDGAHLMAIAIVYVDDVLMASRLDYDKSEILNQFTWGSSAELTTEQSLTFKGKELSLVKADDKYHLKVTQKQFIANSEPGQVRKGRIQEGPPLSMEEQTEFPSLTGSIQWLAGQTRPELAAWVSLANKGKDTGPAELAQLYSTLDYAREHADDGLTFQDVAINRATTIVGYADSSWANAAQCASQQGCIVLLTTPHCTQVVTKGNIVDWRSNRSSRVCRSTLAAESIACDDCVDRAHYVSLVLSELLTGTAFHRDPEKWKLRQLQVTDCKSLFDAVSAENPRTTEKRTYVDIRSIQEFIDSSTIFWCPTTLMWADGLTKLLTRWASVPSTALPSDQRRNGEEDLWGAVVGWIVGVSMAPAPRSGHATSKADSRGEGPLRLPEPTGASNWSTARRCVLAKKTGQRRNEREYPFIPCTCCERKSPIPRLAKLELGQKAKAAITLYAREAWVEG
eukprot:g29993.t1